MIDFNKIKKDTEEIVRYSQEIENPDVNELIDHWKIAKNEFFKYFGDNTIYEYPEPVDLELSEETKKSKFNEFIDMVRFNYDNQPLGDFLMSLGYKAFYNNCVPSSGFYEDYNGTKIKIQANSKIVKSFKYFVKDPKFLNDLQMRASMVIQENKIHGTLCLSVDVRDFLSSSENTYNWRSCHALDGDYRGGNLSYMVDSCTFMCYLKGEKEEILPRFPNSVPWNSKKWRMLMFLSEDEEMLFAGRQYPFKSDSILDFLKNTVLPKVFHSEYSAWTNDQIDKIVTPDLTFMLDNKQIPIGSDGMLPIREVVTDGKDSLHYNDLLYSSYYVPYYCFKLHSYYNHVSYFKATRKSTKFKIGGRVKCLCCGENTLDMNERMWCGRCEMQFGTEDNGSIGSCPRCGSRFYYDDGYWVDIPGETVCPNCVDAITECSCCGSSMYIEDLKYVQEYSEGICSDCYHRMENNR